MRILFCAALALLTLSACGTTRFSVSQAYQDLTNLRRVPDQASLLEQVQQLPYPSWSIRTEQEQSSFMLLSHIAGGLDYYAVGGGATLALRHGRILRTDGLAVDAFLSETDLPSPAVMIGARQSQCWRSGWRASGQKQAMAYWVKGCLQPAEATATGWRVTEHVTVPAAQASYINHYELNAQADVVASQQQLGPSLPVLTLKAIKPREGVASAPAGITADLWSKPGDVKLDVVGLHQVSVQAPSKLSDVLLPLMADPTIDWQGSALYCSDPNDSAQYHAPAAQLEQQREALLDRLAQLADVWRNQDRRALASSAEHMRQMVAGWRIARRVPLSGMPVTMLSRPQWNLALSCQHYTFVAEPFARSVPVLGLTSAAVFDASIGGSLARFSRTTPVREGASSRFVWQISAAGRIQKIALQDGYLAEPGSRRLATIMPGDRLLMAWDPSDLPDAFAGIVNDIAELAAHAVLTSEPSTYAQR